MIEKWLGVAAVAVATGFSLVSAVGGCSSEPEAVGSEPDAKSPERDAGMPKDSNEPEACGPKGPNMTLDGMDAKYGWKPPAAPQAACSKIELDTIEANTRTASGSISLSELFEGTSERCKACAVSDVHDEHWAPIVTTGGQGFYNLGACLAAYSLPECARQIMYHNFCIMEACKECSGADAINECAVEAVRYGSQCDGVDELPEACRDFGVELKEAAEECGSLVVAIRVLCGVEAADGGDGED